MRITSNTKYADFEQYEYALTEEGAQVLMAQAEEMYGQCSELTIDEFWGLIGRDYSLLGDMSEPSVLQVYWCKRFAQFCEQFAKACERLKLEPTETEKQAQTGCMPMSPQESMLTFVRSYFGLHSFYEAGKIRIGEYLLARKDAYNDARAKRNYANIQQAKLKHK